MFETLEARRLMSSVYSFSDGLAATQSGSGHLVIQATAGTQTKAGSTGAISPGPGINVIIAEDHGTVTVSDQMTGQEEVFQNVKKIDVTGSKSRDVILYEGNSIGAKINGEGGDDYITSIDENSKRSTVVNDKTRNHIVVGAPPTAATIVGSGDFNHDGKPDLLWRDNLSGQNFVWLMNGSTLIQSVALPGTPDHNWRVGGVADFNGDGNADIAWRNSATGKDAMWYMNGTTLVSTLALSTAPNLNWKMCGAGDLNGDGTPDLVWRNYATGQDSVWLIHGLDTVDVQALPSQSDLRMQICGVADYNNDGMPDLYWHNTATYANSVSVMNRMTMTSTVALSPTVVPGWQMCAAADFDQQGGADVIWRNRLSGVNALWLLDGSSTGATPILPTL